MHIFFIKSLLSLIILLSAGIAAYSMYEIYGRKVNSDRIKSMKTLHRGNGILFLILSLVVAFLCIDFMSKTEAVPSLRGKIHSIFAISVFFFLAVKISILRIFRTHYAKAKVFGAIAVIATLGTVITSAGYYLAVTKFGTVKAQDLESMAAVKAHGGSVHEGVDQQSMARGKALYEEKCYFCHDAYSNISGVGPGHKGIMRNPLMPVSRKPSTPENIISQIRNPYKDMPAFSYLSDNEINDLIAFLRTL